MGDRAEPDSRAPPVYWQFYGHVPIYYLDYLDGTTRGTLYAVPGGSYVILVANTRAGLTIPPGDGRWVPGESYDVPLHRKVFLKLRAHIHKSRRRSGTGTLQDKTGPSKAVTWIVAATEEERAAFREKIATIGFVSVVLRGKSTAGTTGCG